MVTHSHDLGDNSLAGPFDTKDLSQLLEVVRRRVADREDSVAEPSHTQAAKLLVKELNSELAGEQGNVFDDGKSDAPLLVFG